MIELTTLEAPLPPVKKIKGKPITCRLCGHIFKIHADAKAAWREDKIRCPSCRESYCCIPPTEKQLRELQDLFYDSGRNEKYMKEIYEILYLYSQSLILKSYSNLVSSKQELEYFGYMATSFVIEEYYKNINFVILDSFGGFLIHKIRQAIWGKHEHSTGDFSINKEDANGKVLQIADSKNPLGDIERQEDTNILIRDLCLMVFEFENFCVSKYENYVRVLNLWLFLTKGEAATDKFFYLYGRHAKNSLYKTLEILKKELYERAANN